jgi:hypothetical protein
MEDFVYYISEKIKTLKKLYYKVQFKLDPLPKNKKGETTEDWLKRIPLRDAIRYVNCMRLYTFSVDQADADRNIGRFKRKKDKEILKELTRMVNILDFKNKNNYELVMERKRKEEK